MQLPKLSKIETEIISYRKIKNIDMETFKEEYVNIVNKIDFVNNDFDYNYKASTKESNPLYAPLIKRKVSTNGKPKWVDEEFMKCKAKRRKLEKAWRKDKGNPIKRTHYIEQREPCAELSKEKQQEYYSKIINDSNNDQKTLFNIANTILNKNSNRI